MGAARQLLPAFARAPPSSPINANLPPQTEHEPSTSTSNDDQGLKTQSISTTPSNANGESNNDANRPNSAISQPDDATIQPNNAISEPPRLSAMTSGNLTLGSAATGSVGPLAADPVVRTGAYAALEAVPLSSFSQCPLLSFLVWDETDSQPENVVTPEGRLEGDHSILQYMPDLRLDDTYDPQVLEVRFRELWLPLSTLMEENATQRSAAVTRVLGLVAQTEDEVELNVDKHQGIVKKRTLLYHKRNAVNYKNVNKELTGK